MTTLIQSLCSNKYFASCLLSFFCLFAFFTKTLTGATIFVGPPPASIQTAINGAANGDVIQLSSGTYVQEVQVISKSLTILGTGQNSTIIQAPGPLTHLTQNFTFGVNFWCVVMVDNQAAPASQTVNISDLTVDGDSQQDTTIPPIYGNSDRFFAIGYHNANGTIQNVHTTSTRQFLNFNELAGGGIICAANVGTVACNVVGCLIDFYQRSGIDCRGAALTANISNSVINRGYVLTPNTMTATPNGIQFSGSTTGSIVNNTVEGNISTILGAEATGILPFGAGPNFVVSGNVINNNDNGIVAIQCGNNLTISDNTLNFTTTPGVNPDEGIVVQDTNGLTTITSNVMNNIPDINMDLSSTTNQSFQLMDNRFNGSQTGLLVTGATTVGPLVTMNHDSFTGTVGYYIQEATAPNDIWPSTATVSFDGLVSGHITLAQFNHILTKIFDKHNDPALGLVLDFIVPAPPVLFSINPNFGPASGGNPVTIIGSGFITGNTTVNFGATPATNVIVVSDTIIIATAPPGTGTVDVTVVTPFGVTPITPADQYAYALASPALFSINPNFGPASGGNAVTIIGSGFITGNTTVNFGATPATNVIVVSDTIIIATAPPGTGTVDVTVVTPFGVTPITPADQYAYATDPSPAPIPPSQFIGVIKKNKFLNKTDYILKSKWEASPSLDVVLYRIYKKGHVVDEIAAGSPLVFATCLDSKHAANKYQIVAVNSNNLESAPVSIRIAHD